MKVLSLWQPWASSMVWLWKQNETRSWSTKYRGPVAIHAAKQDGCSYLDIRAHAIRLLMSAGVAPPSPFPEMPRGKIIGVGELVDVIPAEEIERTHPLTPLERAFGDYGPGRFVWIFTNLKAVTPLPLKGAQGLRSLPEEVVSQVEYLTLA